MGSGTSSQLYDVPDEKDTQDVGRRYKDQMNLQIDENKKAKQVIVELNAEIVNKEMTNKALVKDFENLSSQYHNLQTKSALLEKQLKAFGKGQQIITSKNEFTSQAAVEMEKMFIHREEISTNVDDHAIDTIKEHTIHAALDESISTIIRHAIQVSILASAIPYDEQLDKIISCFKRHDVKKGSNVITCGEWDTYYFVVIEGEYSCFVGEDSNDVVITFREGQSFGELSLMYQCPRTATIRANADGIVYKLSRDDFTRVLQQTAKERFNKFLSFLAKVNIFKNLPEDIIGKISSCLEQYEYVAGETIIREGEIGDTFHLIYSGKVTVTKVRDHSKEHTEVGSLGPGDYFGELALMGNDQRKASCIAEENTVTLVLKRNEFVQMVGSLEELKKQCVHRKEHLKETLRSEGVKNVYLRHDIRFEDLETISSVGAGAFGRVLLTRHKRTKETFALKSMKMRKIIRLKQKRHVFNEKLVMEMCDHTYILKLYNTFKDGVMLYILSEFCLGGELFQLLRCKRRFDRESAVFYAASVVLAFEHMHNLNIVYRDLKPENIMLDSYGFIKVVDFGFAKVLEPGARTYTLCGTPDYLAPEVLVNKGHSYGVDWWALGILIYELLAGYAPFTGNDPLSTYKNILARYYKMPHQYFHNNDMDLINGLLQTPEHKRTGCQKGGTNDVKAHIWFDGIDWELLEQRKIPPPFAPVIQGKEDISNFPHYARGDDEVLEAAATQKEKELYRKHFKDF